MANDYFSFEVTAVEPQWKPSHMFSFNKVSLISIDNMPKRIGRAYPNYRQSVISGLGDIFDKKDGCAKMH